jgi:hypothetical protein
MKARSIFALVLPLALLASVAVAATAGARPHAGDRDAPGAKLTIDPWTHGFFGSLETAEDGCLADRRVVVYEQQGQDRDPESDRQVAVTRTAASPGAGDWSMKGDGSGDPGRYYAEAEASGHCAAAASAIARPDSGNAPGGGSKAPVICGTNRDYPRPPKQLDECFYAAVVSEVSCFYQHLYNNPVGKCRDPSGVPCFCEMTFDWRLGDSDSGPDTHVEVNASSSPYYGISAVSRGDEFALYALSVGAGDYANVYPPQGEPGKAGGPLRLYDGVGGKTVRLEGILYKK